MIEPIIEEINTSISNLSIFKIVNGLCEYIEEPFTVDDNQVLARFPALYEGNDNLGYVTNMDYGSGVVFHLSNGDVTETELDRVRTSEKRIERSYPMRCIAMVSRNVYGTDNPYSPYEVAANLEQAISKRVVTSVKSTFNLEKAKVDILSTSQDKTAILTGTFENIDFPAKHILIVVSVDYEIILRGADQCFTAYTCN